MSCPGAAGRGASASRSEADHTDERFPRASRLTARRSFLQVYERGQRVTGSYFVVFGSVSETGRARLGITATKKCGDAVVRNRLKRLVREIYRRHRDRGIPGLDLVVNVRPAAAAASFARLEADLMPRLAELARRLAR